MNLIRPILSLLLFVLAHFSFAQTKDGITFIVEDLKRPDTLVSEISSIDILKKLAPGLKVHSDLPDSMVDMGAHPFLNGMHKAYAEHRPFELSPDMIWLLICQGFSQHVNNNSEELRELFVNFEGKKTLIIRSDLPSCSIESWEKIIPDFITKAGQETNEELFDLLTPKFSTTSKTTYIATQITALESVKSYFEFMVLRIACGIPEITLRGTPKDWQLMLENTRKLKKYKLDWWIDEMIPVLEKIVETSKGNVDKDFWRNMFKYHDKDIYGVNHAFDGWIVKFFPYDNKRNRNDFKIIRESDRLPNEQAAINVSFVTSFPDGSTKIEPLSLMAGFWGVSQNKQTQCLTPQISWLVADRQDISNYSELAYYSKDLRGDGIEIRVNEFPEELLLIPVIRRLRIVYTDSIDIPDEFARTKVDDMYLVGKITVKQEERIKNLFPNTNVTIDNGSQYDDYFIIWDDDSFPSQIFLRHRIRTLSLSFNSEIKIPNRLAQIEISKLMLKGTISPEEEARLVKLFSKTDLYINDNIYHNEKYWEGLSEEQIRAIKEWEATPR